MAVTWPYGIPPDPQIYAYLAAAAASYPYALPNPGAVSYPTFPLQAMYQTQTSSAFSPLAPQSPLKPAFNGLTPLTGPLTCNTTSSTLERLSPSSSAPVTSVDPAINLSQRLKPEAAPSLPGLSTLKGCPCGLPSCALPSGLHPSFPTLPSALHPGFHSTLPSALPGMMSSSLAPFFQKPELHVSKP